MTVQAKRSASDTFIEMEAIGYHHSFIVYYNDGNDEFIKSFGKMKFSPKCVFEIGSVSKGVLGILIQEAIDKKILNLNDELKKYIPLNQNYNGIKLKHLVTHTSGLPKDTRSLFLGPNIYKNLSERTLLDFLNNTTLGEVGDFVYSNVGAATTQLILEKATKLSFENLLNNFQEKHGIEFLETNANSVKGFLPHFKEAQDIDLGNFPSFGAIKSNIESLSKLGKVLIDTPELFEPLKDLKGFSVGKFWGLSRNNEVLSHAGLTNKHSSFFGVDRTNNKILIVLSNTRTSLDHLIDLIEGGEASLPTVPWWTKAMRTFY